MPYKVSMRVESRVVLDNEMIDHLFDAITNSLPIPLGCFDSDMAAKPGGTLLELTHLLEEVDSIDVAGTWTLIGLRDALRELDATLGIDISTFDVTEQIIEKWEPPNWDEYPDVDDD